MERDPYGASSISRYALLSGHKELMIRIHERNAVSPRLRTLSHTQLGPQTKPYRP